MSHQTHYRSYRGRFLQVIWPNQQCQSTEGSQLVMKPWIPTGPLHHVTIVQLYATASMHGVRVPMWNVEGLTHNIPLSPSHNWASCSHTFLCLYAKPKASCWCQITRLPHGRQVLQTACLQAGLSASRHF